MYIYTVKQTTSHNLWPWINWSIETARSVVSKNRAQCGFFLALPAVNLALPAVTIVARQRKHFRGFWADFFVVELPQKRGCFNTQGFTRFLLTGVVSALSRALTCPFKQSNPSVWSLLSWHPTHTHLWVRLFVFLKLFVSTVTVPPSDSDYVNRSASLQQFRLIHRRRAQWSRSGGLVTSIRHWIVLFTESFYTSRRMGVLAFRWYWLARGIGGIGLQASAGAAEHEARSRAEKILATVVDSPSKSVSCRWGSSPAPQARFFWLNPDGYFVLLM